MQKGHSSTLQISSNSKLMLQIATLHGDIKFFILLTKLHAIWHFTDTLSLSSLETFRQNTV